MAKAICPQYIAKRGSSGDSSGGETPCSIPNQEVKPSSADGTWGETPWESRSLPVRNLFCYRHEDRPHQRRNRRPAVHQPAHGRDLSRQHDAYIGPAYPYRPDPLRPAAGDFSDGVRGLGLLQRSFLVTRHDWPRAKNTGLFFINYVGLRIDRAGKSV